MSKAADASQYREMPILFIIGSGRCGSSLIHELVARHRDAAFVSNIEDNLRFLNLKGRYNNALLRSPIGRFTKKGRLRFAPSEAYNIVAEQITPLYKLSTRNLELGDISKSIRQRFERFFGERLEAQRQTHFVHKYTGWARARFFKDIFPKARFVHVVRDGRAVANSFVQMPWWSGSGDPDNWRFGPLNSSDERIWRASNQSAIVLAGLAWKIYVESIEADFHDLPDDDFITLRYEDFLDDPAGGIRKISKFADLTWDDDIVRQMKKSPIRPGRSAAFRDNLSESQQLNLFDAIGDKLLAFGYER